MFSIAFDGSGDNTKKKKKKKKNIRISTSAT